MVMVGLWMLWCIGVWVEGWCKLGGFSVSIVLKLLCNCVIVVIVILVLLIFIKNIYIVSILSYFIFFLIEKFVLMM